MEKKISPIVGDYANKYGLLLEARGYLRGALRYAFFRIINPTTMTLKKSSRCVPNTMGSSAAYLKFLIFKSIHVKSSARLANQPNALALFKSITNKSYSER